MNLEYCLFVHAVDENVAVASCHHVYLVLEDSNGYKGFSVRCQHGFLPMLIMICRYCYSRFWLLLATPNSPFHQATELNQNRISRQDYLTYHSFTVEVITYFATTIKVIRYYQLRHVIQAQWWKLECKILMKPRTCFSIWVGLLTIEYRINPIFPTLFLS